ncbi:MAG: hypothetical protein FJ319_07020 [SAR202 cluster bacterium]|nr:hypothetical protein [SAR202 cluster bacterium]
MSYRNLPITAILAALSIFALAACGGAPTPSGWSGAVVQGDRVYIGTMDRDVRAIDVNSGDTVWKFPLRGTTELNRAVYGTPALVDNVLYFAVYDGLMYAVNTNGREVWSTSVGGGHPFVGSPAVADGKVLIGSNDHHLYALDAASGSQVWRFKTGNMVWSSPVVDNGRVYIGSLDQKVYALRLSDGSKVWEFEAGGSVTSRPLVADGRVYVGSFGSKFFALNADTGSQVWEFDGAGSWYWADPIKDATTVYAASLDGNLYALDAATGGMKWKAETNGQITGAPALLGSWVMVGSTDGRVRIVNAADGSSTNSCNIGPAIRAPLTVADDRIYVSAADRSIRSLTIKSNGNPDEEWVHRSNKEDPVDNESASAC